MSRLIRAVSTAVAVFAAAATAATAHHTYVKKYDNTKLVNVAGTVQSVSYVNPHVSFTVESGGTVWTVETESIPKISGKGVTAAKLVAGAKVSLTGWPARDGGAEIGLKTIRFGGGTTIQILRSPR